jgi:endo-1,4-beta-D-glucanase Y
MIETTVDYWTCLELAQALEQTMRNDLWSTADRIAETASRITSKPEELVAALQQYEIKKAALKAANSLSDSSITTISPDSTSFSKAG